MSSFSDWLKKLSEWAAQELKSMKFWVFVASVVMVAGQYFTGLIDQATAIKLLEVALAALLGFGLMDAGRNAMKQK